MAHTAHDFEAAYMPALKGMSKAVADMIKHTMEEQRKLPGVTPAMMEPWDKSMAEYEAFARKFGLHP